MLPTGGRCGSCAAGSPWRGVAVVASAVEDAVRARIAAVQRRRTQEAAERAERAVRRRAGVDARNRAKLARLAVEEEVSRRAPADADQ